MKYSSNDSVAIIAQPKLKKSKLERADLKKAKKDWKNSMKAKIPGFRSTRGCIGMSTKEFIQIPELIKMTEIVTAVEA